jgi:hypothetical protein
MERFGEATFIETELTPQVVDAPEEARSLLLRILTSRFGELSWEVMERVQAMDTHAAQEAAEKVERGFSLEELNLAGDS